MAGLVAGGGEALGAKGHVFTTEEVTTAGLLGAFRTGQDREHMARIEPMGGVTHSYRA